MGLTNKTIPNLKTGWHSDIRHLTLVVTKAGSKIWKYRRDKTPFGNIRFTVGEFPAMKVEQARNEVAAIDEKINNNIDPRNLKSKTQLTTFGEWATVWTEYREKQVTNKELGKRAYTDAIGRLNNWILPQLGNRPLDGIEPHEIYALIERIANNGYRETAKKSQNIIGQIYDYAISRGGTKYNPARIVKSALPKSNVKHMPHLRDPDKIAQLMRDIWNWERCHIITRHALRITPYLMLRPQEIRLMRWGYIDFDKQQINIPPEVMKRKARHVVPLPRQALELILSIQPFTSHTGFVFPHASYKAGKPMSESCVNGALKRMGYKDIQTAHGFRHTAKTTLEEYQWDSRYTEKQLAHDVGKNSVEITYNHAEYLPQRRVMLQAYADYLDGLRDGLPFDEIKQIITPKQG